jgi:phage terminase large subunit-like protein
MNDDAKLMHEALAGYRRILTSCRTAKEKQDATRQLAERDLFFFLRFVLTREDVEKPWVFARCREWQRENDGIADTWAREHYKSSIGTEGGILWGHIHDPERTYCILSYNRTLAKKFLRQIKEICETTPALHDLWPDIFWKDPVREAPKWSENDGLVFKRKGTPKESSIEAWGILEGQPTGMHFSDLDFEDAVVEDAVKTPDMRAKTLNSIRLSFNVGKEGGRRRWRSTIWHYADPGLQLIEDGVFRQRKYTATRDGKETGEPVIWTREFLAKRIRELGPYNAACQLFLDPKKSSMEGFDRDWLRYWRADRTKGLNLYIICDPANSKKKTSDYTCIWVVGLGADRNYYAVNGLRDRLSLTERANVLFRWHQQYRPLAVGYEKYGKDSDIEHFEDRMQRDNYRFTITPLAGKLGKPERIGRLVAPFHEGRIFLPESLPHTQYDGETVDVIKQFINDEYLAHPFEVHDDMLDCLARILDDDLNVVFPQGDEKDPLELGRPADEAYDPLRWGLGARR